MSAANKAKGTRFESEVSDYLQTVNIRAKRLPRTGVNDIGDVAFPLLGQGAVVIEAKNRAALDWPTFLSEAAREADAYEVKYPAEAPAFGVVVAKRRGKGVSQSYVVMTLEDFADLMHHVSGV